MDSQALLGQAGPTPQAVVEALARMLNADSARALDRVAAEAEAMGLRPYLVGGVPRDLLLGRSSAGGLHDLDVVVEGDAPDLGRRLARLHGGRTVVHERFRTATWLGPDADVDLVTARRERYAAPAALPTTEAADLDADLRRRDFGINAIAIAMDAASRGELVDPCAGIEDLRAGRIRALHPQSFVDDPTRGLRAARFAARLSFRIEDETHAWLRDARWALDRTSGARLANELLLTMLEPSPSRAIERMREAGLLAAIAVGLGEGATDDGVFEAVDREVERWTGGESPLAEAVPDAPREVWRLLRWLAGHGPAAAPSARRLDLAKRQRDWLRQALDVESALRDAAGPAGDRPDGDGQRRPSPAGEGAQAAPSDHELERALAPFAPAALLLAASLAPGPARDSIHRYAFQVEALPALVDGNDLVALGVERGPALGALLERIRQRQLDQGLTTRAEALALARAWLASSKNAAAAPPDTPEPSSGANG